jgi:3-phosphoshikimate 1-carboxyvinyltransferase
LILSGEVGGWTIETISRSDGARASLANPVLRSLEPAESEASSAEDEMPYVTMTTALRSQFPRNGGRFVVEPDASSGSYFWATPYSADLAQYDEHKKYLDLIKQKSPDCLESMMAQGIAFPHVSVTQWPTSGWQVDQKFPEVIHRRPPQISRRTDLGDSIMTAIVMAPLESRASRFTDLGRLRLQECERVEALRTELTKCGAEVLEQGDTLTVFPSASKLHGAEIETYHDHRMAMCFAVLGLKVPGIKLRDPSCVKKTFPNFFQKLAAAPPNGLGVTILDGHSGRKLSHDELFAE